MRIKAGWIIFLIISVFSVAHSQELTNRRTRWITPVADSIRFDTLSIIPGSLTLSTEDGEEIDSTTYYLDPSRAMLFFNDHFPAGKIRLTYRVFPYDLSRRIHNKDLSLLDTLDYDERMKPYIVDKDSWKTSDGVNFDNLDHRGSISRGISVGNRSDLAVNSNFDLQLSGMLTKDIEILAAMTDQNIPIQPDGNTAAIQDFDKVFIQLKSEREKLILGDFAMINPGENYFLRYQKKAQGLSLQRQWPNMLTGAGFSFARGKFSRNEISGREGDQGPYRLSGAEGERFIIVIAGTERVYLNGRLMERGLQNDYVIDYSLGEITFTPNRLITKYDRVIVEFQYANRDYTRSVFNGFTDYEKGPWTFRVNLYSEQDHKNSPLFIELDEEERTALANAGDDPSKAFIFSADTANYREGAIFYRQTDTPGYTGIFVYSDNNEYTLFDVDFSYVGAGKGNYRLKKASVNGRIYEWVAPINGKPRGSYSPIRKLPPAQQQQMATVATEYSWKKNSGAGVELAMSNRDQNTFSPIGDEDNKDFALKAYVSNTGKLSNDKNPWTLSTTADFEHKKKNFAAIERYRPVEFQRQWDRKLENPGEPPLPADENYGNLQVGINKKELGNASYRFSTFIREGNLTGYSNSGKLFFKNSGYEAFANTELTRVTSNLWEKEFLIQSGGISREISFLTLGGEVNREAARHLTPQLDSNSYRFLEYTIFTTTSDTSFLPVLISFSKRRNSFPVQDEFVPATEGNTFKFETRMDRRKNYSLNWNFNYRNFKILDTLAAPGTDEKENSVLSRLELDLNFFKRAVSTSSFYQIGTGNERKTEFRYVRVPIRGQGNYIWIDYNGNRTQELDEFLPATGVNKDTANYLRLIIPTNEFIRSVSNEFNQRFTINPSLLWRREKGILGLFARFYNTTYFRIQRKSLDNKTIDQYNPLLLDIEDTSLVKIASRIGNTLILNKNKPFSIEYRWNEATGKVLLLQGFDSRSSREDLVRIRWDITRRFFIYPEASLEEKTYSSDLFVNRNYFITSRSAANKFSYQPSGKVRFSLFYRYKEEKNLEEGANELLFQHEVSGEVTLSFVGKGTANLNFTVYENLFSGNALSPTAYEMMQGLQPGRNYTWFSNINYNLRENLQLTVTYNGQKSGEGITLHSGNVSARYLF